MHFKNIFILLNKCCSYAMNSPWKHWNFFFKLANIIISTEKPQWNSRKEEKENKTIFLHLCIAYFPNFHTIMNYDYIIFHRLNNIKLKSSKDISKQDLKAVRSLIMIQDCLFCFCIDLLPGTVFYATDMSIS